MTKTVKRRHGERRLHSLYRPLREIPINHSTVSPICRKLVKIITKLKPLSEQNGIMKFLKNTDHANVLNGFVQDLAHAVTDYQVRNAISIDRAV
jgi:hypothetical protein